LGYQMAIKTTLEQIEEVQACITEAMTSQELDQGSDRGRLRRPDLRALQDRETMLLDRYRREQGGGIAVNHGIPRRTDIQTAHQPGTAAASQELYVKAMAAMSSLTGKPILYGPNNKPLPPTGAYVYQREAAKQAGSMENWRPQRVFGRQAEAMERQEIVARSIDLSNNDSHAAGIIDNIAATGADLVSMIESSLEVRVTFTVRKPVISFSARKPGVSYSAKKTC
jgi:hypothetical protein